MNSNDERPKRPLPERTGPVRNPYTQPPPSANPGDAFRGVLECAVQTAYTVIDDYMRRGYEAARTMRDRTDGRDHMPDERTNYGSWSNPWGPMAAPMQQWFAALQAWNSAWSAFVPNGWPAQMWNPAGFAAGQGPAVSVSVSSQRPAEITTSASLNPGVEFQLLVADPLAGEGSNPPLKGVAISSAPGSVRIAVPVAADQPAGKYTGAIRTTDGRAAGNLTVVISELSGTPA